MSSQYEERYAQLVREILVEGNSRETRNAPTRATFGKMLVVNELSWGQFPILSCRKMYPRGVLGEFAAFLKGPKSVEDFTNEGCNYWNKWAADDGSLTLDYGNLWRDFNGVDQIDELLNSLSTDPHGRRHIISGWNPANLGSVTLPCCHLLYQWFVEGNSLQMIWYQRSVDTMIGLPSDVILAAAWNILIAEHLGLNPGKLVFMLGDTHIYESHVENAFEYVRRVEQDRGLSECPTYLNEGTIDDFHADSISLIEYDPLSPIYFELH